MSEYWVSKKKYFCKYCDIYIADDAPSRQHHENGMRHKGNRERFIRGLYKQGEKKKKDLEEEKREMARVESAAQAAFSQDVGSGLAKGNTQPVASSSKSAQKPAPKPASPFTNYSTAASLGYTDPDAERIAAEEARRRTQGVAGDWQVVETPAAQAPDDSALDGEHPLKRPAEESQDDARQFKLRKKTLATGLGEIYDPGAIKLKPKKKESKEEEEDLNLLAGPSSKNLTPVVDDAPRASEKPKWTTLQWKRPAEGSKGEGGLSDESTVPSGDIQASATNDLGNFVDVKAEEGADVKPTEHAVESLKTEPPPVHEPLLAATKTESSDSAAAPAPMFRKRKAAAGAGSRVKREV